MPRGMSNTRSRWPLGVSVLHRSQPLQLHRFRLLCPSSNPPNSQTKFTLDTLPKKSYKSNLTSIWQSIGPSFFSNWDLQPKGYKRVYIRDIIKRSVVSKFLVDRSFKVICSSRNYPQDNRTIILSQKINI